MTTETEERYQEKKSNNIILPIILGLLLLGIGIWAFSLKGKNATSVFGDGEVEGSEGAIESQCG